MTTYQKMKKATKKHGENNDCAVKAVAILGNLPYELVLKAFRQRGRSPRGGASTSMIKRVLRDLNIWYDWVYIPGKTIRTLSKNLPPKGRYMVMIDGHVLAAVNGQVEDWTDNRLHRIQAVYKISF